MKLTKLLLPRIAALIAGASLAPHAIAQSYPAKPVRIVVGFAIGGGTDTLARLLSKHLAGMWGQAMVIDSRPGADGAISTEITAKSPPDGYTIVMISNAHTITPFQRKLAYDPVKDFAPVTLVASTPNLLLVHPSLPVKSVKELVTLAKSKPGALTFGSSGAGTSPYLAMELLKSMAGIELAHVPYKGSGQAVIDLVGGHIQVMFGAISTTLQFAKQGKVRALAVSSRARVTSVPDMMTVAEAGFPGFEASTWYGVLAPARTPADIVQKLHADIAVVMQLPEVKTYLAATGFDAVANTPTEFAEVIRTDMAKWGKILSKLPAS